MQIDRNKALGAFAAYAARYNDRDPKVKLKIDHTYRVAGLCARIAAAQGLDAAGVDLAWLCGLLHDVGRFEQLRRYGTLQRCCLHRPCRLQRPGAVCGGTHPGLSGRRQRGRVAAPGGGAAQRLPVAGGSGPPDAVVLQPAAGRGQDRHPASECGNPAGGDLQCHTAAPAQCGRDAGGGTSLL